MSATNKPKRVDLGVHTRSDYANEASIFGMPGGSLKAGYKSSEVGVELSNGNKSAIDCSMWSSRMDGRTIITLYDPTMTEYATMY